MVCDTPDLGRILGVALWALDDCMAPIYGTASGYWDDCPAAVNPQDNIDDGEPFTRRCSSGRIKRHIPGEKSLESIQLDVDLHWVDSEWQSTVGLSTPIMFNGEVVGTADGTNDQANILVGVALEVLGGDVCADDDPGCNVWWKLYPIKGARITEEGELGKEDAFIRVTGETVSTAQLGSGPMPLFCDPDDGTAAWADTCFPSGQHRYQFSGAPVPTECGSFDTEEPDSPCTPGS